EPRPPRERHRIRAGGPRTLQGGRGEPARPAHGAGRAGQRAGPGDPGALLLELRARAARSRRGHPRARRIEPASNANRHHRDRPMRLTAAVAALSIAFVLGCSRKRAGGPSRVPVTVAHAEQRAVPFEITATGSVEPLQTVDVQSQVTGVQLRAAFREGDEVAAGQLLFQIDPRPFQAALDQAQAMLARDQAQAQSAVLDAQRYADLVKQDYVTKSDYDAKQAAAQALRAAVRADSAAVTTAQLNLEWASIRAPITGRTGRLLMREGNLVRANSDALVVINQTHPILVRFAVPEQYLADIQRYRANRLPVIASSGAADTTFSSGGLTFVDNAVDTTTGTVL